MDNYPWMDAILERNGIRYRCDRFNVIAHQVSVNRHWYTSSALFDQFTIYGRPVGKEVNQ
jgi:hypothetical protein